jgi:hypothetical protein
MRIKNTELECTVEDCKRLREKKEWCGKHYQRWLHNGHPEKLYRSEPNKERYTTKAGYVRLYGYPEHPNADSTGRIQEHTFVMSEHLGRPLLPGEEVHHKNGVRDDNRIENLELWVKSQPAGQRAKDLVVWAKEILGRYGDLDINQL